MRDAQLALPGVAVVEAAEWTWTEDPVDEIEVAPFVHTTVMRAEVVDALAVEADRVYVDATLGGGGHTEEILERATTARVIAFDRDAVALEAARARLARFGDRVTYVHAPFSEVTRELESRGVARVAGLCADLGVSSPQLDEPLRGMSFRREGPIDMRMDQTRGATALDLIASSRDDDLADIIFRYGGERRSRRIARSIKRALQAGELETTLDLRRAIVRAVGPVRVGGVDPATRSFQALRIAVNGELDQLEALLASLPSVLEEGAAASILSFHSLEDRLVKHAFQSELFAPLTKKPLMATDEESAANPRARSAKLRAARFGARP